MKDITLENVLDRILCATAEEINPVLNAVTERFGEVYPDHELLTITIQGHDKQSHLDALQKTMDLVSSCK